MRIEDEDGGGGGGEEDKKKKKGGGNQGKAAKATADVSATPRLSDSHLVTAVTFKNLD